MRNRWLLQIKQIWADNTAAKFYVIVEDNLYHTIKQLSILLLLNVERYQEKPNRINLRHRRQIFFLKLFLWTLLQLNFEKAHILCLSKELFFCCVSKDFLEGCCSTTDNKEDSCETQCRYLQPLEKRVDQQDSMKKKLAAKSEILISHFF